MFHSYGFFDERKNYNFKSNNHRAKKKFYLRVFFVFRLTEKSNTNSSCYTYPTLPIREFHDLNAPVASAIDDREYAIPEVNFYSTFSPQHNLYSPRLMRISTPQCCIHQQQQQQYLTMYQQPSMVISSIQEVQPIEAICGNSLMMTIMEYQPMIIKEFDINDLVLIKKIGDGSFGSIHLAELKIMNNKNVIVKSLNDNTGDQQK